MVREERRLHRRHAAAAATRRTCLPAPSGATRRGDSIPGAVWLPNVGFGELAPETEAYFRAGLARATGSDLHRPIVIFCMRDCWMSWNAAKRALGFGYTGVHWFPDGTDGWTESGIGPRPRRARALDESRFTVSGNGARPLPLSGSRLG